LFHTPDVLSYIRASIREIGLEGQDKNELKFLDVACGTAPNACWFREADIPYVGVDNSEAMINRARMSCPGAEFVRGDVRQASIFGPKLFSHVLMLNQVVYNFPNAKILADNAAYWLKPDGLCIVHMVHPNRFNPVLDLASPFAGFSIQK
jgi:ubiquinone/menaquinone biosynthesis C-methylase UbiE